MHELKGPLARHGDMCKGHHRQDGDEGKVIVGGDRAIWL
jgi:hypothetical protein